MLFQTLGNLMCSVVGYLVGDAFITEGQAYAILILLNALDLIVGVVGLGQVPGLLNAEGESRNNLTYQLSDVAMCVV